MDLPVFWLKTNGKRNGEGSEAVRSMDQGSTSFKNVILEGKGRSAFRTEKAGRQSGRDKVTALGWANSWGFAYGKDKRKWGRSSRRRLIFPATTLWGGEKECVDEVIRHGISSGDSRDDIPALYSRVQDDGGISPDKIGDVLTLRRELLRTPLRYGEKPTPLTNTKTPA